MTSLEDQFLKQNIPGKYSAWSEELDDVREAEEPEENNEPTIITTTTADGDEKLLNKADDDVDDDDDEFLQRHRQERLKELQQQQQHQQQQRQQPNIKSDIPSSSLALIPEIQGATYVNLVNQQDEYDDSILLIVLYHNLADPDTRKLLESLVPLAAVAHQKKSKSSSCYWRRMQASTTGSKQAIDPIALPALLIHQHGDLKHSLAPIRQHLPDNYTKSELEELLESCGVTVLAAVDNDDDAEEDDDYSDVD
jgi:hypothetical protein